MNTLALLAFALIPVDPPEETVQGLYEGTVGERRLEGRLVAMGKSAFRLYLRLEGPLTKAELDGTNAELITLKSKDGEWTATWDGALKGKGPGGLAFEARRVQRKPPSLGKAAPAGAVILLDGKTWGEISKGKSKDGIEEEWKAAEDGSVQVPKGGMNSKRSFDGSFDYHVEFLCPFQPPARGQGRGNSGCYLPNGDEVQVLDSFGMDTYKGGGCGGLYNYKDPDVFDVFSLASLPPLEWQTYDMEYRVEKVDGKPAGKPKLTVWHNGLKIHDAAILKNDAKKGGFHWQDHGNPVRYRNLWVLPQ